MAITQNLKVLIVFMVFFFQFLKFLAGKQETESTDKYSCEQIIYGYSATDTCTEAYRYREETDFEGPGLSLLLSEIEGYDESDDDDEVGESDSDETRHQLLWASAHVEGLLAGDGDGGDSNAPNGESPRPCEDKVCCCTDEEDDRGDIDDLDYGDYDPLSK